MKKISHIIWYRIMLPVSLGRLNLKLMDALTCSRITVICYVIHLYFDVRYSLSFARRLNYLVNLLRVQHFDG